LEPNGLTPLLVEEIRRYGCDVAAGTHEDLPLLVVLAWPVHRNTPLKRLDETNDQLGGLGQLLCLDREGNEVEYWARRDEDPRPVRDVQEARDGLTAMRQKLVALTSGRLMIGGKCTGFSGRLPGLVEEALLSLVAKQPLYLAAGFGGATAEIARVLSLPMDWLPDTPKVRRDVELDEGLALIKDQLRKTPPADTGLDEAAQAHLARTHRPSEIATLVSQGLFRLASRP